MGLTQNRIENSQTSQKKQKESTPIIGEKTLNIIKSDQNQQVDQHGFQTTPISIPQFLIKISPFRLFSRQETPLSQINSKVHSIKQEHCFDSDNASQMKQKDELDPSDRRSWLEIVYHSVLFGKILEYLSPQDDSNLMLVNHRIYSEIFLHRLLIRENNWLSPLSYLKSRPHFQEMYWKLSQYEQESQHSLDLDRTESFFHTQASQIVDKSCQVAKLDRIMKALTASSVPYSQGINSIVAKLISFFEEQTAYWIMLFLMKKTNNIHNDCEVYRSFMADIQTLISEELPQAYKKLDDLDFNVQYFAMKWIMSLFAYDFNREILFYLWDILLIFDGFEAMKLFILSIFEEFQEEILQQKYDRDEINTLLKHTLKQKVDVQMGKRILKRTKIHIVNKKYGSDFLRFYELNNQRLNTLNLGFKLNSARKNSRHSDDINFINLLESPKQDKFHQQIQEQPQQLEESSTYSIAKPNNLQPDQTVSLNEVVVQQYQDKVYLSENEKDEDDKGFEEEDSSFKQEQEGIKKLLFGIRSDSGLGCEKTTLAFD